MDYILMHRKKAVAEIEIDGETSEISRVGAVFAAGHIPVGITLRKNQPDRGDLNDWWHGRSIPASRQNIRRALEELGVSTTGKLLSTCYGLSLSDQYWVNPVENPLEWDNINFFCNPFPEDVGDALFGGDAKKGDVNLVSPDNTSDGWLKKKWKIIDGKRCLIKGGSDPFQQQPINEAMAAAVMGRLNIPHVPCAIIWENGLPYSVCENFIDQGTELVTAFNIHNTRMIKDAGLLYDHYLSCCIGLGIPGAQDGIDKMIVADYLINNNDRHLDNFGAIRDAVTLEWVAPAPLYDNGSSFWYDQSADSILASGKTVSQPFLDTHEEQIKLVKDFSWVDFAGLSGIDEEWAEMLRSSPFIDTARRDALCFAFSNRLKALRKR